MQAFFQHCPPLHCPPLPPLPLHLLPPVLKAIETVVVDAGAAAWGKYQERGGGGSRIE
jgi:hypothetical protein